MALILDKLEENNMQIQLRLAKKPNYRSSTFTNQQPTFLIQVFLKFTILSDAKPNLHLHFKINNRQ